MLLGKKQQMWLNKFKIALVQKDTDSIDRLLNDIPVFSNKEEMEQAMYLMREATQLLYRLQDEITVSKKQIKQGMNFLASSLSDKTSGFNIKS